MARIRAVKPSIRTCGLCHLAAEHPIHDVPEVSPERKAFEARKTGDR